MKNTSTLLAKVLGFVVPVAGILVAALGFVALLGWVLGLPLLASFGEGLIPMAPSTAVLFVLYGAAIGLRTRTALSGHAYWISVAMVGLGTLVALMLFSLGCMGIHWSVEHLGLSITQAVGETPRGYMSPVTAFCFLLTSVSFLASLSKSATRRWHTVLALGSAGVLLGACCHHDGYKTLAFRRIL